jgi:hypothetical protein
MNKKQTKLQVDRNWRLYHCPGMPKYAKRKKNAVFISPANSLEHEKAKLEVCYELRKIKHEFITEAVSNKTGLRHDVVDLNLGWIYEIETNIKRAQRFNKMENVVVIPLWQENLSIKKAIIPD